jgi:6-pyruvoyltetrahydropterin/6-carboxytetrahydropterin synthase
MTYGITVKIQFRAGHRLLEPYKGKCNNIHGEGYTAICTFKTDKLDKNGMVVDFGKVKKEIKDWINDNWDHAYIYNEKDYIGKYLKKHGFRVFNLGCHNPTAEYMAQYLFSVIVSLLGYINIVKVGIVESFPDSIGWYSEH